jgi:leader peptidase (prepilin peptidase)/N-methyltransferase
MLLSTSVLLSAALVAFLVPIALADLRSRRIPNRLTGPAALLAVVVVLATDPGGLPERGLAAATAGGAFLLVALASPEGMGMGDVKLVAVLGLYLGGDVAAALLVALAAASLAGVAILLRWGLREGRRATIPLGPFLALGGVVALIA